MVQDTLLLTKVQRKRLERRLESLRNRFGTSHFHFACHAAFLPSINVDILNLLWISFQCDIHGEPLNIPWIAISDLIFSPLCDEVGYELYEMHLPIRKQLLKDLRKNPRFGEKRIEELADFLRVEAEYSLDSPDPDSRDLAHAQLWTALAYTSVEEAVQDIARTLTEIGLEDSSEWARMTSLISTFEEPLKEASLESLLIYVKGMYYWNREEIEKSQILFNTLPIKDSRLNLLGIQLTVPTMEPIWSLSPSIDLDLEEFEFDVATIEPVPRKFLFGNSWSVTREKKKSYLFLEKSIVGLNIEMVSIPGGEFIPGYSELSPDLSTSTNTIGMKPFFMGRFPITQIQWKLVSELPRVLIDLSPSPASFAGPRLPVENINWHEAVEFCARISKISGKAYRLPNETEWEYACKAGTNTPFHFGNTISPKLASYDASKDYGFGPTSRASKSTNVIGNFNSSNSFGLSDMHGNVAEWCSDVQDDIFFGLNTKTSSPTLPKNKNTEKIVRGGSWLNLPEECLSTSRAKFSSKARHGMIGLRIVMSF